MADSPFIRDVPAARALDAWRDAYEPPLGRRMSFYTVMHGKAFDDAARATENLPGS